MELNDIKKYWDDMGRKAQNPDGLLLTSRDPYLGQLERENILEHLLDCRSILEIGCGDGLHSVEYATRAAEYHGVDVAPSLLSFAEERMRSCGIDNATFHNASILEIEKLFGDKKFDVVISQRCIINLPTWEHQSKAIHQVFRALRPGGRFLITEGFQEELDNLNCMRRQMGLEAIKVVDNNRFMSRHVFEKFVGEHFSVAEFRHYGLYLYLSHLFHPLIVLPDEPKHVSLINEIAMKLSRINQPNDFLSISYNLFYVLQRQ